MTVTLFHRVFRTGLQAVLAALMIGLLAVMSAQIIWRYGLNSSLLWSEELCRYMLIWVSFLAVIFAYERGEIAALSFLSTSLPRVGALVLAIVGGLFAVVLCFTLVYYGYIYAGLAGGQPIPALRFIYEDIFGPSAPVAPSVFWVYFALPLGMGLLGLRILIDIGLYGRAIVRGETLGDVTFRTGSAAQ
ncbi:TRAP-type C4-dicarboxylate transport system permease small subunit [Hoeflea marina]|uniref:TRAP transporter small permease protein n=1 Tax=Hoeflea marina TaxID=274592 RepID=A0A317PCI1_9HYPH|nr:TRAP transporter small permease subunit [Hoeflea marina]PWV95768.1 TRAP-type C4-dicarboxylate transport system permease small subunit [Hoeflea marina]